ncbi:Beta-1,3-endoglucanase, family GH17 [Zostera marina]|uniref:glucan endo-1,3-beta-D-glucosidase n=1 Tax=Zostera marina TaxID=29655 RepID=A0A0K9P6S6_ZOSMR|nr:Beta-1,3-endoglucanase, family GH17 [Zostera marina]
MAKKSAFLVLIFSHNIISRTGITRSPSVSDTMSLLEARNITHIRLFDPDHNILTALANTGIQVIVGVPNDQIPFIGKSRFRAANWIKQNIAIFIPATNITHIAVGNEILTMIPNATLVLLHAMKFLHYGLVSANLNFQVKISTPQSTTDLISDIFPPSTAFFNSSWNHITRKLLRFMKNTNSPFMLNVHPYYEYTRSNGIFPLEYAIFEPLALGKRVVDPNTNILYENMFVAMVDAVYYSMCALKFCEIPILVTETGWPWASDTDDSAATINNALRYNTNLILRVLNNIGTPIRPENPVNAYIYELFNKDQRFETVSKKSWGIFFPNGTSVYDLNFIKLDGYRGNSSEVDGLFCIAYPSIGAKTLAAGLNWACDSGGANCDAIQPGKPCYQEDLVALASYAYNDYYHRTRASGGTCSFGDTAFLTNKDPSHGLCIFAGSTLSNTTNSTLHTIAVEPKSSGINSVLILNGSRMIVYIAIVGILLAMV